MKKNLLISFAILVLAAPAPAHAESQTYTVLLAGGAEESNIRIWLTADGREYVIDSIAELEVGGEICFHGDGKPTELVCPAPSIAGFEVNAGGGGDRVTVARQVKVPVTMRGGAGDDVLAGGAGDDKLIGSFGRDRLDGGQGDDLLIGGEGNDILLGGPGHDMLRGGYGKDTLVEGRGKDAIRQQAWNPPR
jgi:Ca2+-binding RTX toxin-like protein